MLGKTVALLESRLGEQLAELVVKHGGRPFRAPALAEIPDIDSGFVARLLEELHAAPARVAIFQTGVGTSALFRTTDALKLTEAGARVIVQRYGAANPELEQALHARGAEAIVIPVYRWSLPEDTRPLIGLMDALARREIDAVVFTSASQAHNLFALATELGRAEALAADLGRTLVASIGPVATRALRRYGMQVGVEPSPPKLGPLITALDQALSR
ncbi:MAG: uroporphyrinogen-III synthase [Betaproteobacteria bacterium]|nr:uroporphyrinogen-III synthase [Betaproteobacteria bacterium]